MMEPVARIDASYGDDGMLLAAYQPNTLPVGTELVRLSDAKARIKALEELAKAFEAEANQMREVSIKNRHRAEAAEALLKEARDKALEEAAKVADNSEDYYGQARDNHESGEPDFYRNNASAYAAMDIAAAIRALKGKP